MKDSLEEIRRIALSEIKPKETPKVPKEEKNEKDTLSLRIEALKMAYDLAYKINLFRPAADYNHEFSNIAIEEDMAVVFEMADENIKYLLDK